VLVDGAQGLAEGRWRLVPLKSGSELRKRSSEIY